MSAPDPRTYNDYLETLVYHLGGAADERNQVTVRAAIRNAYRDLVMRRTWNYFWAKARVDLNAPYSTGTVQYTEATRALVLTGGSWPAWAGTGYASVRISNIVSRIDSVSGATATLNTVNEPIADIAAGTAYTLYQSIYPLPSDFRSMERPVPEVNWWAGQYISPAEWMALERQGIGAGSVGNPTRWTVAGDPVVIGGRAMFVWPYPSLSNTYDFMYQRNPRPIVLTGVPVRESVGTVSNAAAVVMGVGTSFNAAHVGACFRFGSGTGKPTGNDGLRPYAEQQTVLSVQSTTQLTLATTPVATYAGVTYLISDPIDLPESMLTAFERGCEKEISNKKDRSTLGAATASYQRALLEAFESDQVVTSARYAGGGVGTPLQPTLRHQPNAFQWS